MTARLRPTASQVSAKTLWMSSMDTLSTRSTISSMVRCSPPESSALAILFILLPLSSLLM